MTSASKSYMIEFGLSMLVYTIVLPTTMTLIEHYPEAHWRFAVALAPVVPLLFALIAMLRFFGRIDELARKIQLEAFAVAAGVTGIATFAYGMLQNVGFPPMNMTLVLPFTIAAWGVAAAISSRRYQ